MNEIEFNKKVDERVKQILPQYLQSHAFMERKLTDTPTDAFATVSRKYVTLNGASSGRPTSSIVGQHYFDTDLASGRGKDIVWNGTGFVDGAGSYV